MPGQQNNSARIDQIANGFQQSQILFTAIRLELFDTIGTGEMDGDTLSQHLNVHRQGLRILCDALVVMGLLKKHNGFYSNSETAIDCLTEDSPHCVKHKLLHSAKGYERWGQLIESVKTGTRVPDKTISPDLVGNEAMFANAMGDIGRISAEQTADVLDLSGVKTMLEIGGGPGLYSIALAQKYFDLSIDLLDSEETLVVAKKNIATAGLQDRIHTVPGDMFSIELEPNYDFIFISNVMHIYSNEQNSKMVKRMARWLQPDGCLCIKDFLANEDRCGPEWAILFAVNMLVSTDAGDCYTLSEIKQWLNNAGLTFETTIDVATHSKMIFGRKP